MDRKQAVYGVVIACSAMALIFLFHHLFKHPAEATKLPPKIETVRQQQPLPPNDELDKTFQRTVHTVIVKKPPQPGETLASPTRLADMQSDPIPKPLVNEDAHPIRAETLPSQTYVAKQHLEQPGKKFTDPEPVQRPYARRDDDDEPKRHGGDGVCAKYGGHKVTFHKRSGWESWRCVYPHRR